MPCGYRDEKDLGTFHLSGEIDSWIHNNDVMGEVLLHWIQKYHEETRELCPKS